MVNNNENLQKKTTTLVKVECYSLKDMHNLERL